MTDQPFWRFRKALGHYTCRKCRECKPQPGFTVVVAKHGEAAKHWAVCDSCKFARTAIRFERTGLRIAKLRKASDLKRAEHVMAKRLQLLGKWRNRKLWLKINSVPRPAPKPRPEPRPKPAAPDIRVIARLSFQDRSYRQIAADLGTRVGSVAGVIHRNREAFNALVAAQRAASRRQAIGHSSAVEPRPVEPGMRGGADAYAERGAARAG